jgi:hypothetical protein
VEGNTSADTECWEWKGLSTLMLAVSGGSGISADFALPYDTVGGGERSPRIAAVEIGDANQPEEVSGGTKIYFRGQGIAPVGVVTFRGTDTGGPPDTVIPIVPASLVQVSGSLPPSSPTISGNTIINFTPNDGATLYSIVLNVNAAGVDIGEGDRGLIIPDFV